MIHRRSTTDLHGSARADEPGSGRVSGARILEWPRWPLASLASAAVCAVFLACSALAQDAPKSNANPGQGPAAIPTPSLAPSPTPSPAPSAPVADPPAAQSSNPSFRPGFIDAVGRWLGEGADKLKSDMQGARESFDKFGDRARDAAKDATGTVTGLPNTRVVTGRERCAVAANGAPDCQAAAITFCRGKGFQSGKSVDTQSEQKCPAKVLLEGRAPNNTECPTEIFVTRAVCQ